MSQAARNPVYQDVCGYTHSWDGRPPKKAHRAVKRALPGVESPSGFSSNARWFFSSTTEFFRFSASSIALADNSKLKTTHQPRSVMRNLKPCFVVFLLLIASGPGLAAQRRKVIIDQDCS